MCVLVLFSILAKIIISKADEVNLLNTERSHNYAEEFGSQTLLVPYADLHDRHLQRR